MIFVNEEIPEEEKSRYDFNKFKVPCKKSVDTKRVRKWTVNKTINAFLVSLRGSMPGSPAVFGLYLDGYYYTIYALEDIHRINKTSSKPVLTWDIKSIDTRMNKPKDISLLVCTIIEAFKGHGYLYQTEEFERVIVQSHIEYFNSTEN